MKEAYLRMSYLYQASHLVALSGPSCLPLSRFYAATMKKIGSRLVIRRSPHPIALNHTALCSTQPTQRRHSDCNVFPHSPLTPVSLSSIAAVIPL